MFKEDSDSNYCHHCHIIKNGIYNSKNIIFSGATYGGTYGWTFARAFNVSDDTKIWFDSGYTVNSSFSWVATSNRAIPYKIYGAKTPLDLS